MAGRSRILLVHSNTAWSSALRSTLGEGFDAVLATTPEDAWSQVDGKQLDLIVAEERVGVAFLEDLSRRAPATPRAILLNGGDRRPWVEAAAEGHKFEAILERAPDLAPRLRALLATRAEPPRALSSCSVELKAAGGRAVISGALLRLTSEMIGVRVEPGDGLDEFLPGQELEQVVLRRAGEVVVEAFAATVQSLRPDSTGGYELEMALSAQRPPGSVRDEEVVRDPLQRASLVMEALRRGQLVIERTDGRRVQATVRGHVDVLTETLLMQDLPPELGPGCAARLSFESGGAHYRFVAALGEQPGAHGEAYVAALLPSELRGRRRARPRVQLQPGEGVLELVPLLSREPIRRAALDVEMEGLGFVAEPGDLLPVGTRLAAMRLLLPDGIALRAAGRIVSRASFQAASGARAVRCGVQLDRLAPEDQSAVAEVILKRTHRGLELVRGLDFDGLWSFLRDCGFLYPEKEEKLRGMLPQIRSTLGTLLDQPHGPLRTLVFRGSGGLLQGHISALHAYRRTWIVQHLTARKEGPGSLDAAKALTTGIIDYLEQLPDAEWVRVWYRPKNRWPARTFGRFVRLRFDPHRCDLRTYAYLTAPTSAAREVKPSGVVVTSATAADWAEIRRCIVAHGDTALLSSEDLSRVPDLSEVEECYHGLGLRRHREGLVARGADGRLRGFALLEISSPGLNLSELTNAFRLHPLDGDPAVTTALAARALRRYAELGQALAIGLVQAPDAEAWAAAGFAKVKDYTCLTVHRSLWRRYLEFVERIYDVPARGARPRR